MVVVRPFNRQAEALPLLGSVFSIFPVTPKVTPTLLRWLMRGQLVAGAAARGSAWLLLPASPGSAYARDACGNCLGVGKGRGVRQR